MRRGIGFVARPIADTSAPSAAAAVIAPGIGATSAGFGLVSAVRPNLLPFADAGRIGRGNS
jgi:hypothetical protein